MRHADTAVVVTNPEVSSVRDSDRIIGMLDAKTARAEKGERIAVAPRDDRCDGRVSSLRHACSRAGNDP